jgi:hypothetical protein
MSLTYTTTGHYLDDIITRARGRSLVEEVNMNEALHRESRSLGYLTWDELLDNLIHIDRDVFDTHTVHRKIGRDMVIFDFEDLLKVLLLTGNRYLNHGLPVFEFRTDLTVQEMEQNSKTSLIYWVTYKTTYKNPKPLAEKDKFLPKGEISIGVFNQAFRELWKGDPSILIRSLCHEGFLNIPRMEGITQGEPQALIELELRKKGNSLGEPLAFPGEVAERPTPGDRYHINKVDDQYAVIYNDASSKDALRWKLISREYLESLIEEMKSTTDNDTYASDNGPRWIWERCITPVTVR